MKKIILPFGLAAVFFMGCKTETKQPQQFLTVSNMDSTVKPGDNFYMYVNGKWYKNTVIPATESGGR